MAEELVRKGAFGEGEYGNRRGVLCNLQMLGGLLVALSPEQGAAYEARFQELLGRAPARIGEVIDGLGGMVFMR